MAIRRSAELRKISASEFAKRMQRVQEQREGRFAFFLGAGCSISSGIPAASKLVRDPKGDTDWLRRLRDVRAAGVHDDQLDDWARRELPHWNPEDPSSAYGDLIGKLFLHNGDRQREIERLCDNEKIFPGFGYAVLSRLMADGIFNVVLTTNFDDVLTDACFYFSAKRPLIILHDSLAPFIRPTITQPMIVKLHGDHRLTPRNLAAETEELNEAVAQRVATVLHDRGLVFIGYGGNDESIIRMLERLPDEALPFGVYWISDQEPRGIFRHWLEDRSAVWVQHRDFDELMLLVKFELELPDPTRERYDDVHARYGDRQMQLLESVAKKKDTPEAEALQSAAWWVYDAYVSGQASVDPPSAKERYLKGLELFPDSYKLRGNYAWFLENELKDFDGAQTEYEKAIKANPAAAPNLGNFANFLTKVRQNHDEAEEYYDKAVKADPKAASYLGNFAIFLTDVRQNPDKAEKYYRLAVEADSKDAKNLGNFANFLTTVRQNHDEAEKYYRLAIDADPKDANNIGNFSQYLLESGQSLEGLRYWREALALNDPEDAALTVELMFYGYAHGPASELSGYLSRLKKLLGKGARSKGWNFSRNVERATKIEKHPAKIWLAKLAAVCNGSAEITTLDKWKAWRDA